MDNKFSKIKERVLYLIECHNDKKENFFEKIGMSYGNFKGTAKNTPLNSDAIANILTIYPDTNPDWLVTGEGSMFREPLAEPAVQGCHHSGIPLIPIEAMAGFTVGDCQVLADDCPQYVIPELAGVDFMIQIKGQSMTPHFNSGDIVACCRVPEETWIQWNKVYVMDTVQGPLIKRLHPASNPDMLTLVSDNPTFHPFDIPKSDIRALALVVATIRFE